MTLSATNEAIASAQRILEAVQEEAELARYIVEGHSVTKQMNPFDQQNVLRTQLVSHAWRKIGRQVLAMHPEIVEEVRIATSDKVPADVLRTLPYMNPMVVFAEPPKFNTWLPKKNKTYGRTEHSMRLLGFFTYGVANVRVESRIEQRIYATNAPEAEKFGMMLILETMDEFDKRIDLEMNSVTIPFGSEMTLAEVVEDLMGRFHWDSEAFKQADTAGKTKMRRWLKSLLSVAIGSLFYLCSTTLEAEEVPRSYTAKRVPTKISRKPLSMFKIGWTTGAALTRLRQRRLAGWRESEQGDIAHQQDPQHRRSHFKMQPYGPNRMERKLIFVSAYWTHVERLGEGGVNTARNVPRLNGKGSAQESVRTALSVVVPEEI